MAFARPLLSVSHRLNWSGECGTALSILAINSAAKVTTHVVRDTHDVMRDVTLTADWTSDGQNG